MNSSFCDLRLAQVKGTPGLTERDKDVRDRKDGYFEPPPSGCCSLSGALSLALQEPIRQEMMAEVEAGGKE